LTQHFVDRYLDKRAYYRLSTRHDIDNPDERMSQDVETFCNSAFGLFIAILDAFVTVVSFVGVLWLISVPLTFVAIGYSFLGCLLTIWIGNRLVNLQFQHTKLEADLRYTLADVRRDVESIAFYRGEQSARKVIFKRIAEAIINLELMMVLQRNLTFFTVNFNYLVVLIPAAIIAPLYFAGTMEFGDITRAGIAFGQVFGGMTLLIGQFTGISGFIANINRLGSFVEILDEVEAEAKAPSSDGKGEIQILETDGKLVLDKVSVDVPNTERRLVADLDLMVGPGESLIIMGPSGSGKSSLLRAIAGIWKSGQGRIVRPRVEHLMFLPQRPFVPRSTLREAICYPITAASRIASDVELESVLKLVNMPDLVERAGGLDIEQEWRDMLSLGEQQRLTIARLILARPRFAFLDEATSALDADNERLLYNLLKTLRTTVISVGHKQSLVEHHQRILRLTGDGGWEVIKN